MAGEDDDIVVTIENEPVDPNAGGEVVTITEEPTSRPVKKAESDDIVGSLKNQLAEKQAAIEAANQRATSAESIASQANQRARSLEHEATEARTQIVESTRSTIDSGIAAAKSESQAAEEALVAAFEAGNGREVAKAQSRVARAQAEIVQLEQAKADIPAKAERKTETRPEPQGDPVEQWIADKTPQSQAWLRKHMDYVRDAKKNNKLQAAHMLAVSEDIAIDSPSYFEHIEKTLGMKKAADPSANGTTQRRPTAPVAPSAASAGGMNGGAVEVTLSATEARSATDGTLVWNYADPTGKNRWQKGDPIGIQEMARRKKTMREQGRYQNFSVDGT